MRLFWKAKEKLVNTSKKKSKDFIEFTGAQFQKLASKKINIPIELFHL